MSSFKRGLTYHDKERSSDWESENEIYEDSCLLLITLRHYAMHLASTSLGFPIYNMLIFKNVLRQAYREDPEPVTIQRLCFRGRDLYYILSLLEHMRLLTFFYCIIISATQIIIPKHYTSCFHPLKPSLASHFLNRALPYPLGTLLLTKRWHEALGITA